MMVTMFKTKKKANNKTVFPKGLFLINKHEGKF